MRRFRSSPALAAVVGGAAALVTAAAAPALAAPPSTQTATPTISSGPAEGSFVASTSATFKFSDKTAKATFTCSLDGATATACTSPKTFTSLAQGKHTLTIVATAPSHTASSPTTRTWTVDTVAPKPAIAAPTGLTSPVVIAFGEPVRAAHATIATLTLTDSGAEVPTAPSCWSGATQVACSALFDTLRLNPGSPLTSGQHYTATVPAASVHDRAGNANAAVSKAFRAARSLQENAPGIAVAWQTVKTASAAGGSYVRDHLRTATASYSFSGTSISWITVTGPTQGKADVYIDGARKKTWDNYALNTHYGVARTLSGLTNKAHRLRIVVLGTKNTKSHGTFVSVDAFRIGSTTDASPTLATTWRGIASSHLSGHHAIVADLGNETLTFAFRGTGVTFYTVKGLDQGKVSLYVDGVRKATWDDYASSTTYNVKRTVSSLTDAVHTLRLVVLGKHHKGAKGNLVTVDRFIVA